MTSISNAAGLAAVGAGREPSAAQSANRRNTCAVILSLIAVDIALGYGIGCAWRWWHATPGPEYDIQTINQTGLTVGAVFAIIGVLSACLALMAGARAVLIMNRAKPATVEAEPVLHDVVTEMAIAAGLPKPRVYVMKSEALNAFVAGMSADRAAIAVTRGLLNAFSREQLRAVVAREMGFIPDLDSRYMTATAVMMALTAWLPDLLIRCLNVVNRGAEISRAPGGAILVLILSLIELMFGAVAMIALLAVCISSSWSPEFVADVNAARWSLDLPNLISALRLLGDDERRGPGVGSLATQHLFIVDPLAGRSVLAKLMPWLFATRPPLAQRLALLEYLPILIAATEATQPGSSGAAVTPVPASRASPVVDRNEP